MDNKLSNSNVQIEAIQQEGHKLWAQATVPTNAALKEELKQAKPTVKEFQAQVIDYRQRLAD